MDTIIPAHKNRFFITSPEISKLISVPMPQKNSIKKILPRKCASLISDVTLGITLVQMIVATVSATYFK